MSIIRNIKLTIFFIQIQYRRTVFFIYRKNYYFIRHLVRFFDLKLSKLTQVLGKKKKKKGILTLPMEGQHVERVGSLHDLGFVGRCFGACPLGG
jgi:hypothetical protein